MPHDPPIDFVFVADPQSSSAGGDGPLTLVFTDGRPVEAHALNGPSDAAAYVSSDAALSDLGPVIVALAAVCSGRLDG